MELRLHHFEPSSTSNGPGHRAVVWVQGCTLGCPGCFNPLTHSRQAGEIVDTTKLGDEILHIGPAIEGITISGGEPLQQTSAVVDLLTNLKKRSQLSVVLFTGFTWEEIQHMPAAQPLLALVDVFIAGRFQMDKRIAHSLIGSSNKTMHFLTQRYNQRDFSVVPEAEIFIDANGEVELSGIDPLMW
jgi:anaerobic ribonucleoside-triphosphate reductase activating protein